LKLLAVLVVLCLAQAGPPPRPPRSANRALHEAWFAMRVEGDPARAQVMLGELLARPNVGASWRARAHELEALCRAALESSPSATLPLPEPAPVHAPRADTQEAPEPAPFLAPLDSARLDGLLRVPPEPPASLPPAPSKELALEELVRALDRRAEEWRAELSLQTGSGVLALVARRFAADRSATERGATQERIYELCTASLEHGLRDDPERTRTRNDWDLEFGNGEDWLDVRMTGGDRSTITALPTGAAPEAPDRALARAHQRYHVHTLDSNTDLHFELQVLEHEPGAWLILTWQPLAR